MNRHPEEIRRRVTREDPATPWVTWYGPAGHMQALERDRVELSRVTFDNWVAKAAGLLADEFDVVDGAEVEVHLGTHWLAPVWVWAVWSLGATVVLGSSPNTPIAIVDDPDTVTKAELVLVSSRHPMGLPTGEKLPVGWVDALSDIRQYPDVRSAPIPASKSVLIRQGATTLTADTAMAEAASMNPSSAQRIVVSESNLHTVDRLLGACLTAPLVGGTTVLIADADPEVVAQIAAQEHAELVLSL